jgi:Bifunctional DNA primase/polymerase, N-terminal
MIAAAQWWAAHGFSVFPLKDKLPLGYLVPHGANDASRDPAIIAQWWRSAPRANVGLAIQAGIFVIDIDGEQAHSSWISMCAQHGEPPQTLTVLTSRGRHLYFRSTVEIHNSTGRIAPSIDVRANGGYTVAPPSVHPSGVVYSLDKRCLEIAEAPEWIVELVLPEKEAPPPKRHYPLSDTPLRGLKGVIGTVANARQGERNSLAFWGACRAAELVGDGAIAEHFAEQLLVEAASCAGLSHAEARVTVRSGLRNGRARHG